MKRTITLAVLLSLALVFGMVAASCDNGATPDLGKTEIDKKIKGTEHPGGLLTGGDGKFDLETIFEDVLNELP